MFIAKEVCDDTLLATVDGTGSNRRRSVLGFGISHTIEHGDLDSDGSDASRKNLSRAQTTKMTEKHAPQWLLNVSAESNHFALVLCAMDVESGGASCSGCAWTCDFDRDGDGDVILCGRIAHPFGHRRRPIPLRWHQHARVEPGALSTNKLSTGGSIAN